MKIKINPLELVAAAKSHPTITVKNNPFGDGIVIARLHWRRGTMPPHLEQYAIKPGECAGVKGLAVYKGRLIPARDVCIAEKKKKK